MMEFFLSKFWAFLIAFVLIAVLVQGIEIDARSDHNEALNEMANELERLFSEFAAIGEGSEMTLHLGSVLPATTMLTLLQGYAVLDDGGQEVRFPLPITELMMEYEAGPRKVDRLVLGPGDSLLMVNGSNGTTMTALSP